MAKGIIYQLETKSGLTRKKTRTSFTYHTKTGKKVSAPEQARIKRLRIPPAWTEVWISASPHTHLQATGRDARGRKQYIYHEQWRASREETKFHHILDFAKRLPAIRSKINRELRKPGGMTKEKVLATVVKLLEVSLIRVGNDEYAKQNKSFGLTTLKDSHAKVGTKAVTFSFLGKSRKTHEITVEDPRLAKMVKRCRDIPGQELFQFIGDDGKRHRISSSDVNAYIKSIAGDEFTAKDFRTWTATVLAAIALQEFEKFDSQTQAKRNVTRAIEAVAAKLGNTPTICRKSYIHPTILDTYLEGSLIKQLQRKTERTLKTSLKTLSGEEGTVLAFLEKELSSKASSGKKRVKARSL